MEKQTVKKIKCECPLSQSVPPWLVGMYRQEEIPGMNHKPGKCKGTFEIQRYKRGGKEMYLCSCCHLPGDKELG